jgi:uncharacterized surface protein with fasciclin (FAS1) repeats
MRIWFYKTVFIFSVIAGLSSCKKWEAHNEPTDPAITKNLFEAVSGNASLSKFTEYLKKTGYDGVLASSRTFTVFAPTDNALAAVDPAIINDSARLRAFVGNHITTQSYFTKDAGTGKRIGMLNGKFQNMMGTKIGDANITGADQFAKNGVLHVIDKMLPVLNNTWESLLLNPSIPSAQRTYLASLMRRVFDPTNAIQIGVNPTTGDPIYQPGTDSVTTNLFWRNVLDVRNESKQYTMFVLTDTAWNSQVTRFSPFFATGSTDSTAELARWEVVKDFAVEGLYTPQMLPDTLVSVSGVKVPIDKSAIVQTIQTSNGIIYVMSRIDVRTTDKIMGFRIEAESYRASSHDRRGNTYFRDRYNPVTGKDFRDVLVLNHGVAQFNLNYRLRNVYSTKYKAYWVAVNDFQTATFSQKLSVESPTAATLPYKAVLPNDFNEIYLGEFTVTQFKSFFDLYLTAANSTSNAANPLVCDYIRLEPSF